jgi:hypothetical protein
MIREAEALLATLEGMLLPVSALPTPQRLELDAAMHALKRAIEVARPVAIIGARKREILRALEEHEQLETFEMLDLLQETWPTITRRSMHNELKELRCRYAEPMIQSRVNPHREGKGQHTAIYSLTPYGADIARRGASRAPAAV